MNWRFVHKDELMPVLLIQGYDNEVKEVTEVGLDCQRVTHFIEISSEASWHTIQTITLTTEALHSS